MDTKFKQLKEITENGNGSIVAHNDINVPLKYEKYSCFFPYMVTVGCQTQQIYY
jgi:hypothetical protein